MDTSVTPLYLLIARENTWNRFFLEAIRNPVSINRIFAFITTLFPTISYFILNPCESRLLYMVAG